MKFKSLLFVGCLSLHSTTFADNRYIHPHVTSADRKAAQNMMTPGYCEIEIINRSYDDVQVYGIYDDFTAMRPFPVFSYGYPLYISLFYQGYCHSGMNLYVDNLSDNSNIFTGYVRAYTTLNVLPFFGSQVKIEILPK